MNKKHCVLSLLLSFPCLIFSQTIDDMSKIVIGVDFQDGISEETVKLKQQLEDKLVHFATQAGCSSFDNKTFFISPNIVVNTVDVAEGDEKCIHRKRRIILDNPRQKYWYGLSSRSFPFNGTATKRELAVKNGI